MESCLLFQHALPEAAILPHVDISKANNLKSGFSTSDLLPELLAPSLGSSVTFMLA